MSATLAERNRRFNDGTGAFSWNRHHAALHPDACVCNLEETGEFAGTPHKHYDEPPHSCARCGHKRCPAYRPIRGDGDPLIVSVAGGVARHARQPIPKIGASSTADESLF